MKVMGGDLLIQIRDKFEKACPKIPACQARFAEVLGPTKLSAGDVSLQTIIDLAYELGLEVTFTLEPKAKP